MELFSNLFIGKLNRLCLLIFFAGLLTACSTSDDRKVVNLILKKDNKAYLFSSLGTFITKNSLDKKTSPPIVQTTKIIEDEGKLFVQPTHLKDIVSLISGNYILHDYQEKSFDGYVTEGEFDVFDKKYGSESTEKIGEMISTANIYLADTGKTKEFHISWQRQPKQKPLKNCIEMSVWADRSYKPGETTVVKEDNIVVNLSEIVEFFKSDIKLDYIEDDAILYIIID